MNTSHDIPLRELLDRGRYGVVIDAMNERNFSRKEDFIVGRDPKIFEFNNREQFIWTEEVIDLMGREGYQPANLADILHYRINNPEDRIEHPIVALNAVFKTGGYDATLCLIRKITPCDLLAMLRDAEWDPRTRFLGVRLPLGTVYTPRVDLRLL